MVLNKTRRDFVERQTGKTNQARDMNKNDYYLMILIDFSRLARLHGNQISSPISSHLLGLQLSFFLTRISLFHLPAPGGPVLSVESEVLLARRTSSGASLSILINLTLAKEEVHLPGYLAACLAAHKATDQQVAANDQLHANSFAPVMQIWRPLIDRLGRDGRPRQPTGHLSSPIQLN